MDCLILAGGNGTRLVPEKGLLPFGGSTLLGHILQERSRQFSRISLLVAREEPYRHFGIPLIKDRFPGSGPLGALLSGLMVCGGEVFLCACDMPFIRKELIACILERKGRGDVLVPVFRNYDEPLCAVYSQHCIEPMVRLLSQGSNKLTGFYGQVRVHRLEREVLMIDEKGISFININSHADYCHARDLMESEVHAHGFIPPGSCRHTGGCREASLSAS